MLGDPVIPTYDISTMLSHYPTGGPVPVTKRNKFGHDVHEHIRTVNIIPTLVGQALSSIAKFTNTYCILVYNGNEANIYDEHSTKIEVPK